jgi:hypothetical protein
MGDDLIVDGGLLKVIQSVSTQLVKAGLIYVNWEGLWPPEYVGNRARMTHQLNSRVPISIATKGVNEFISLRAGYLPFMSALIFERKSIDFALLERKVHSRWAQLFVIFSCLKRNPNGLHISDVIVVDDANSKANRPVKPKNWPSDIYSADLVGVVNELIDLELLSLHQAKILLRELADFIFCDYFKPYDAIKTIIGVERSLKSGAIPKEFSAIYTKALGRTFSESYSIPEKIFFNALLLLKRTPFVIVSVLACLRIYNFARSLVTLLRLFLKLHFIRYGSNPGKDFDVLIITPVINSRAMKLCYSLQRCSLRVGIFDYNSSKLTCQNGLSEDISKVVQLEPCDLATIVSRSSKVLSICVWDYKLTAILLILGYKNVIVDSYDVINAFTKPGIKRKYFLSIILERYVLAKCSGIVCRDLRTNLLRKEGFKLGRRILFMDYMYKPAAVKRVIDNSLVYVGNLEADASKAEAFQYELAMIAEFANFKFYIFPSYPSLSLALKYGFTRAFSFLRGPSRTLILENQKYGNLREVLRCFSFGVLVSSKSTLFQGHTTYSDKMSRYFFAGKVFDYCEAGVIPLVEKGAFVSFVLRRLGMGYTLGTLADVPIIIENLHGSSMHRVGSSRFTLDANAKRLADFCMS